MGVPGARRAKASVPGGLHACCEDSGILPHRCPGLSLYPTRVPATCRCQPWGRGVPARRLSCWRDGLGNRLQATAWLDRRTLQGTAVCCPREVDRSARHVPHAHCPQVPRAGLGMAPALCQPAAPMFSENVWLDCICIMVQGRWQRGGVGMGGAVFFDPVSVLSFPSSDFSIPPNHCRQAVVRWFSTRTRSPFRTFRENELLGPSLISRNRISRSPWLRSTRMGSLVLGPGPGVWPVVAAC